MIEWLWLSSAAQQGETTTDIKISPHNPSVRTQSFHRKDTGFSEIPSAAVSNSLVYTAIGNTLQTVKKWVGKNPMPHLVYYSQQTEILLLAELFLSQ